MVRSKSVARVSLPFTDAWCMRTTTRRRRKSCIVLGLPSQIVAEKCHGRVANVNANVAERCPQGLIDGVEKVWIDNVAMGQNTPAKFLPYYICRAGCQIIDQRAR